MRIELDDFTTEHKELRDFSNLPWAQQRSQELTKLIADNRRKIERWQEAKAVLSAKGWSPSAIDEFCRRVAHRGRQ